MPVAGTVHRACKTWKRRSGYDQIYIDKQDDDVREDFNAIRIARSHSRSIKFRPNEQQYVPYIRLVLWK